MNGNRKSASGAGIDDVGGRLRGSRGVGLAGWLLARLRGGRRPQPRLTLVERIALAPRQSLALVEAEGQRILVATSADGGPAFYALDDTVRRVADASADRVLNRHSRVSW